MSERGENAYRAIFGETVIEREIRRARQMSNELKNGERWEQKDFPYFKAIIQWVTDDEWLLMHESIGRWGWPIRIAMTEPDGKIKYTKEEMLARLARHGWSRSPPEKDAADV